MGVFGTVEQYIYILFIKGVFICIYIYERKREREREREMCPRIML